MPDLSGFDPTSQTWRVVKAWANEQLETAMARLEQPGLDQSETENERGAIRMLRQLLGLPDPPPLIPNDNSHYA